MKLSGPSILGILSASNVVPRSRERERVVADRVRDVGEKHSSAAGTEVRCRILTTKKLRSTQFPNFCTRHPCSSRRNLPKPKPPPVAAFDEAQRTLAPQ